MKENKKQKFVVYAVPCNRPFIVPAEKAEEFKKQSEKSYKKFKKLMAEFEARKLNVKTDIDIEPIDMEIDGKTLKKVLKPDNK